MRKLMIAVTAGLLLQFLYTPVWASQRVALVIGNAAYEHAPGLANPLNDAGDLGAALGRLGFKVTRLDNAGYDKMRRGLRAFTRAASTAEVALVFYAGHGIEVDKRNFLIPVDARLQSDREVEFETVSLDLVSRAVEGASGLGLVILDACRDNPFAAAMKRSGAKRSIGRGLARVEPSGETLVAYAAKGGSVAADGRGRNSPYTTALLAHVEERGPRGGAHVPQGAGRGPEEDERTAGAFRLRLAVEQGLLFFQSADARGVRGHGQAQGRGEERRAVVLGNGEGEPGPGRRRGLSEAVPRRRLRVPGAQPPQAAHRPQGADEGRYGDRGSDARSQALGASAHPDCALRRAASIRAAGTGCSENARGRRSASGRPLWARQQTGYLDTEGAKRLLEVAPDTVRRRMGDGQG